jgi:glyoxylase-like metal-dependent hydrolase (beta-lactamase superfamily II)
MPSPISIQIVPVTPFQQNASILRCNATGKGAFVDPGGEPEKLIAAARAMNVAIEKILLTHGHLDHASAAGELARIFGAPIEGPHRDEEWLLNELPSHCERYGLQSFGAIAPDRWLEDGDRVRVGDAEFNVYHCPGHTPGHVAFVHETARFAFVGDLIFRGSIGRTDFPRGDHDALINAIRTKLFPLGDDIQFLPGHGEPSTFGWERKTNPFVSDLAVRQV